MANLIRRRSPPPASRAARDVGLGPIATWDDLLSPTRLRREIDRVFDEFFSASAFGPSLARQFVPSIELTESDGEYVLKAELPGMTENDIQVEVDDDNRLTIRGEKKTETEESRGGYEYSERSYGEFVRTVQLPSGVDASKIQASFQHGVLELHIPKTAQPQAHTIPISKGKGETKKMEGSAQKSETSEGSKTQEKREQPEPATRRP